MTDVIVVGAGVVGLSFAVAAARQGFSVEIYDRKSCPEAPRKESSNVLAINPSSRRFLEEEGAWSLIGDQYKTPYTEMSVKDGTGSGGIAFSATEMNLTELGYIVDQSALLAALVAVAHRRETLQLNWQAGFDIQDVEVPLLVAADGVHSEIRQQLKLRTVGFDYQQTATVCTARIARPHGYCARQWFLQGGPVALLPLADQYRVAVVWSCFDSRAALDEEVFLEELQLATEGELGTIESVGPRFEFPLRQQQALRYVTDGVALLGDAAHAIHPLAGQGANLGFSDARVLITELSAARVEGLLPGDLKVLKRYEKSRRGENHVAALVMEGFHRLFTSGSIWSMLLRNHGLRFVDGNAMLKKLAIGLASG